MSNDYNANPEALTGDGDGIAVAEIIAINHRREPIKGRIANTRAGQKHSAEEVIVGAIAAEYHVGRRRSASRKDASSATYLGDVVTLYFSTRSCRFDSVESSAG